MNEQKLTIITFNTLGIPFLTTHQHKNYLQISRSLLARFHYLSETLNTEDADVILLQEVHLYSLLRLLKKKLTNFPYVSYKRFLYGPRGGLVIFSKYELDSENYLDYSIRGSFKNKTFVTRIIRNGALICGIKNLRFTFINTYITGDFSHKWGEENKYSPVQREQLQELIAAIKHIQKEGKEVIIAGDMNINSGSSLYKEFISSLDLTDAFKDSTTYTHHPEFLPEWANPPRLDHVFITDKHKTITSIKTHELFTKKVTLANGKESYLSDHIALKVSITSKKEES